MQLIGLKEGLTAFLNEIKKTCPTQDMPSFSHPIANNMTAAAAAAAAAADKTEIVLRSRLVRVRLSLL